ncbi:MAG: hypothetical protein V4649_15415 [Bacteroidota bacterium]
MGEYSQEILPHLLRVAISDKAGNKFRFSAKPKRNNWVAIKSDLDVYFMIGYGDFHPQENAKVKVFLTIEEAKLHKREAVMANCELPEGFVPENNAKRPIDIFSKEMDWTDKTTFEKSLVTEFMPLIQSVRENLKK